VAVGREGRRKSGERWKRERDWPLIFVCRYCVRSIKSFFLLFQELHILCTLGTKKHWAAKKIRFTISDGEKKHALLPTDIGEFFLFKIILNRYLKGFGGKIGSD
jgi:hypothetical protein